MSRVVNLGEQIRRSRERRLLAALLVSGIAFLVSGGHAAAAPYTVIQCDSSYSVAHDWGYGTFHPATFYGEDRCGPGSLLAVRARPFTSAPANFGGDGPRLLRTGPCSRASRPTSRADRTARPEPPLRLRLRRHLVLDVKTFIAWGNGGDSGPIPGVPVGTIPGHARGSGTAAVLSGSGSVVRSGTAPPSRW